MPKIYQVQPSGYVDAKTHVFVPHDTRAAERIGEIVPVLPGAYDPSVDFEHALDTLSEALKDFNPEEDFLLPTGRRMAAVMATFVLATMFPSDQILALDWNRHTKNFDTVVLS